jgi:hypothetical protein
MIYMYLTAIGLAPSGSSTVHIYTQTTNKTQNTENGTHITIKKLGTYITIKNFKTNLGSAGRVPSLLVIPPAFALQTSQADTAQYKKNEQ